LLVYLFYRILKGTAFAICLLSGAAVELAGPVVFGAGAVERLEFEDAAAV